MSRFRMPVRHRYRLIGPVRARPRPGPHTPDARQASLAILAILRSFVLVQERWSVFISIKDREALAFTARLSRPRTFHLTMRHGDRLFMRGAVLAWRSKGDECFVEQVACRASFLLTANCRARDGLRAAQDSHGQTAAVRLKNVAERAGFIRSRSHFAGSRTVRFGFIPPYGCPLALAHVTLSPPADAVILCLDQRATHLWRSR